jgi:hypothetical protein
MGFYPLSQKLGVTLRLKPFHGRVPDFLENFLGTNAYYNVSMGFYPLSQKLGVQFKLKLFHGRVPAFLKTFGFIRLI